VRPKQSGRDEGLERSIHSWLPRVGRSRAQVQSHGIGRGTPHDLTEMAKREILNAAENVCSTRLRAKGSRPALG